MKNYQDTVMWKEIHEASESLKNFLPKNEGIISRITAYCKAHRIDDIVLAGRGTSDHALYYFKYAVEIMGGYNANIAFPSIVTLYNGNINMTGKLVIGCSQSGYAADVIAVVKRAKSQGALTVAITNDESSPLAKAAKFHIDLACGKENSVAATKTFIAQIYACIMLATSLTGRFDLYEKYSALPQRLGEYIAQADALTTVSAKYLDGMKDGFVLARGITYPIALEGALKLQETSYLRMRGYAMSDFYHGPMAMVDKDTHVIVYAPTYSGKKSLKQDFEAVQKQCLNRLVGLGAKIVLVTDNQELGSDDNMLVSRFDTIADEYEAMFAFALYAQMLACKIASTVNEDPDNPKSLKKVTITK